MRQSCEQSVSKGLEASVRGTWSMVCSVCTGANARVMAGRDVQYDLIESVDRAGSWAFHRSSKPRPAILQRLACTVYSEVAISILDCNEYCGQTSASTVQCVIVECRCTHDSHAAPKPFQNVTCCSWRAARRMHGPAKFLCCM